MKEKPLGRMSTFNADIDFCDCNPGGIKRHGIALGS